MTYRIQTFRSLSLAEPAWRALEQTASATAFQSFRWLEAWARHVSPRVGETPLIVVGTGADGEPQFLLPLATQAVQGATVLGWLGQSHSTYAMGLFAPGKAQALDADGLRDILAQVRAEVGALSAVQLRSQPVAWRGVANPFAGLEVQPAANRGHLVPLTPDDTAGILSRLSRSARSKLRRDAKRLAAQPGFAFETAHDPDRRLALLDAFLAQKARQLAERGIPNPFEGREIVAFYRDLATPRPDAPAVLECSALHVAGAVVATATSISFNRCRHLLTLSLGDVDPEIRRLSPGLMLMQMLMEQASADGMTGYDLGAGDGQHKAVWQPEPIELVDAYVPLTLGGYAVTLTASSGALAKRLIKGNPRLWRVAQQARKLMRTSGL